MFWLKPSNPFAFYLTFLSERFRHITCNPQIISTRCTQDANSFFSFTQHTPSISHFSVVASLVFTPLNGLRNEGDHKRSRYQGGQNVPKCKQKTHKTKRKTWWSTQLHTTNHRLWKKKMAGFARPFLGIKWHPHGRANPNKCLKFRHSLRYLYKTVAANPSMMVFWSPFFHVFVYFF